MHRHNVSGLPVLDANGRLCGVVTESDLIRVEEDPDRSFLERVLDRHGLVEIERKAGECTVGDVMTRMVTTVEPEAPLREGVRRLLEAGVKRLPVVDEDRRVVGIVSRHDLLAPLLRNDEEIRREVELVLRDVPSINPALVSVSVQNGMVTLAGEVPRRSDKRILADLVHGIEGVLGIRNRLTFVHDDGGRHRPRTVTRRVRVDPLPSSSEGGRCQWERRLVAGHDVGGRPGDPEAAGGSSSSRLRSGGVGMSGPWSKDPLPGGDTRDPSWPDR